MSKVNEIQHGGDHYRASYQHWDFTLKCLEGRYLEGCITKYVTRWRKKNGLQDLQKAMHFLDKLIDSFTAKPRRLVAPLVAGDWRGADESPAHFCDVNGVGTIERYIILEISRWAILEDLLGVKTKLQSLIDEATPKIGTCTICGEPMPPGELMFKYHGYSGPCPVKSEDLVDAARRNEGEEPGPGYVSQ